MNIKMNKSYKTKLTKSDAQLILDSYSDTQAFRSSYQDSNCVGAKVSKKRKIYEYGWKFNMRKWSGNSFSDRWCWTELPYRRFKSGIVELDYSRLDRVIYPAP